MWRFYSGLNSSVLITCGEEEEEEEIRFIKAGSPTIIGKILSQMGPQCLYKRPLTTYLWEAASYGWWGHPSCAYLNYLY
jgi:hypothetical protein